MSSPLLHITRQDSWMQAQAAGQYPASTPPGEGFIHLSTPEQILRVANTFYRHQEDLVLLVIDPQKVKAEVRWEAGVDAPGELYPHLYGPLNLDAVTSTLSFPVGEDGNFLLPEGLALPGGS